MISRSNIRQGQIYWLDQCAPLDGDDDKDRPVIVLTSPEKLRKEDFILVVACSTRPRDKDIPRFEVPSRQVVPETGLPKSCWAIARWYLRINRFRLTDLKGTCPEPLFSTIFAAVIAEIEKESAAAPTPPAGQPP